MDDSHAHTDRSPLSPRRRPRRVITSACGLIIALGLLGLMSVTVSAAPACTDTFTGASGGNWAVAGNWTTATAAHVVPTSSDVVCLAASTVVVSAGAQTASSIGDGTGSLKITGGSLTLSSATEGSALENFSLDDTGSFTAPPAQTVTVLGNFEWGQESTNEQEQQLNAVMDQTGGGTFAIDGNPTGSGLGGPLLTGTAAITTSSPVSITNGLFGATGVQTLTTTSVITLGEIQLDALSSEATITAAAVAAEPVNAGTYGFWTANLILTGGTTTVATNTTLEAGNLTLQSGTIDAIGDISPPPGYALDTLTLNAGTLTGAGEISANVTNVGGTVAPPGGATFSQLTVTGSYTQSGGGTLAIGVDDSDTSILRVYDSATVAGDLLVTDVGGSSPSPGQEFDVVLDLSTTGTVNLTGPAASEYAVSYPTGGEGGAIRLTAAAPPATTTTSTTPSPVPTTGTGTGTSVSGSTPTSTTSANLPPASTTTPANVPPPTTTGPSTTTGTPVDSTTPGSRGTSAPGTLRCPRPTGRIGGLSVGPLALGFTRAHARRTLPRFSVTPGGLDDFCLYGGRDIRVAYPTSRVLASAPRSLRSGLRGRIILALTANPFYDLNGAKPGAHLTAALIKRLHPTAPFRIAGSEWYIVAGRAANGVLKVRAGVIDEVGLANRHLTANRAAQQRLVSALRTA